MKKVIFFIPFIIWTLSKGNFVLYILFMINFIFSPLRNNAENVWVTLKLGKYHNITETLSKHYKIWPLWLFYKLLVVRWDVLLHFETKETYCITGKFVYRCHIDFMLPYHCTESSSDTHCPTYCDDFFFLFQRSVWTILFLFLSIFITAHA